jgi:hypothetical protein
VRPATRFRPHVALAALVVAVLLLVVVWSSTRRPVPTPAEASAQQESVAAPAPAASAATATATASTTAEPAAASASVAPPPDAPDYFAFDKLRAMRQLAAIAEKAARCRARGTPSGTLRVMVTFEPSGGAPSAVRVTQAPYAGTPTAQCVVKKLSTASVPAFRGHAVTLRVPVELR